MTRTPMTGHYYTMGKMKHSCADRSCIGHIWLVLETNGKAVVIKDIDPTAWSSGKPLIVDAAEFDWTPADELAAAFLTECRKENA